VVEHRLLDDARAARDLHHAHGVETALGEQLGGRVDDPLAGLLPLELPLPWRATRPGRR
jgi:hypothetical protein